MIKSITQLWALLTSKERNRFFLIMIIMFINAIVALIGVGAVPVYVGLITSLEQIKSFNFVIKFLPFIIDWEVIDSIIYGGLFIGIIFLIKTLFQIFTGYTQETFGRRIWFRLNDDLFRYYLKMPYTDHLVRNSAELIRNIQHEINLLSRNVIMAILNGLTQIMILPLILAGLLIVQPLVSLVSFLIIVFALWIYDKSVREKLKTYGKILQKQRTIHLKVLHQGLGGIKELHVLQRFGPFSDRFRKTTKLMARLMTYNAMAIRVNNPYLEFVSIVGMLLVVFFLLLARVETDQLAPIVSFYGIAFFRLKQGFAVVMTSVSQLRSNHYVVRPIYDDLKNNEKTEKKSDKQMELNVEDQDEQFQFLERIELQNVSYSYPSGSHEALSDINLVINKGESVGLAGSTGAGKTTLADVILGLLRPDQGQILVDGRDIFSNLPSWNRLIGYIPQFIYLLDDTIQQNVVFGLPDSEVDQERVWEALKAAQLSEFVSGLPSGLSTMTGERGVRLSGGQRQRIGIARALYHQPPVLIMDEATSALDNLTESNFMQAIDHLKVSHTLIIIAHRLSTIRNCEKIVLMEDGRIRDIGSFEELQNQHKLFKTSG